MLEVGCLGDEYRAALSGLKTNKPSGTLHLCDRICAELRSELWAMKYRVETAPEGHLAGSGSEIDRYVQGRNRLIANNEFGRQSKGSGYAYALALAAGKLMRVLPGGTNLTTEKVFYLLVPLLAGMYCEL